MSKFKVGDRVRMIDKGELNYGCIGKVVKGDDPKFVYIEWITTNGQMDGSYYPSEFKKEGEMSKYDELKLRIEVLDDGWNKEADDILTEITIRGEHYNRPVTILINNYVHFIGIDRYRTPTGYFANEKGNNKEGSYIRFSFTSQCEKMDAFKKALLWLLDHSDIKKDEKQDKIKELENKIKDIQTELKKLK